MQRMTGFKGRCSRSVFALASLVLLLASPTDQALAQHKIIEGFVSHGALQWPEYIATEFGWFKEHGLEVDMLVVGAGAAQQVAAGALNIAYSGFPDFIRATNAGAPVKIVINAIGQPPYSVYSKPAIKKISDLKGKIASIGGQRDITHAAGCGRVSVVAAYLVRRGLQKARCRASMMSRTSVRAS